MESVIKIESGVKYLSDSVSINTLPSKCLFDKGKVGCGGTTLAIEGGLPYVIAVPFVSLIENKVKQHPNVFGFYGGVKVGELKQYLATAECPIIMTTYDSLSTVGGYINPNNFNLLVDEYHLLFTQYSFRDSAIDKVLAEYVKYKDYCFMTATPLESEFILDELKDLDIVRAEWEDVTEVSVVSVKCTKGVLNSTIDLVNDFLSGEIEGNLYLFVNSVNFIKELIENTEVTFDNCNVIYSKNNKTEVGLQRGTLPAVKDGSVEPKRINLLTSTVFEGSDIYDENGKIYIVSDSTKAHSLIDISTSFQQIAGRIRNSKHIGTITHLFSNTRYNDVSYEQFKALSEKEIEISKSVVKEFNDLSDVAKSKMQMKPNETYISVEDGYFKFNPNLVKLDIYNFKVCKHLYKIRVNNLTEELTKYGYNAQLFYHKSKVVVSPKDLEGFESVVTTIQKFYTEFTEDLDAEQLAYLEAAYLKYPFLQEAITTIGFEGISDLKYVITSIKRKLISNGTVNAETKVYKILKTYGDITSGSFVAASTLKNRFATIYKELGLTTTAKGSDIEKFFNCVAQNQRINGKVVKGYTLLNPKMIIR